MPFPLTLRIQGLPVSSMLGISAHEPTTALSCQDPQLANHCLSKRCFFQSIWGGYRSVETRRREPCWPARGLPGYPAIIFGAPLKGSGLGRWVPSRSPHGLYDSISSWLGPSIPGPLFSLEVGKGKKESSYSHKTTLFTQCKHLSVAEIQVPRCQLRATQSRQAFQE